MTIDRIRFQIARTLAWLLWLAGWIGLATLVQTHASSVFGGFALLALWLVATGSFADGLARFRLPVGAARLGLAGASVATALFAATLGGGDAPLLALVLAWAATVALASNAVRACRVRVDTPPGPPIASGAAAAALAWLVLADLGDPAALRLRLAALVACAGLAMVLIWPRVAGTVARGGCRAALFDCALPAWPAPGAHRTFRWPLMLAALVMLPMMCGLPLMLSLCRTEAVGPRAALGLHLAAMFVPALLIGWHGALSPRRAAFGCAGLLLAGAVAAPSIGGSGGNWALLISQGAAWSIAWAARLGERRVPHGGVLATPLAGAALNALLVLALGAAVDLFGLKALIGWHLVLGAGAVIWLCSATKAQLANYAASIGKLDLEAE